MKEKVKSALQNKLIVGLAFLLMGIGLIIVPEAYISTIVRIMGAILCVVAISRVITFVKSEKTGTDILGLVITVVIAAFGISFLVNPAWVVKFVYIIFGILIAFEGLTGFINAFAVLRKNGLPWIPSAVLSLAVIALGVIVVFNPFETAEWLYRFIGISLAFDGITDICAYFIGRKAK